jgi:hypothetical protein
MGLFDRFIKEANKAFANVAQNAGGNANKPVNQGANPSGKDGANQSGKDGANPSGKGGANKDGANTAKGSNAKAYFAQILASEFGQYQTRENVPVGELGGEGRPYDFGLYQDGRLVAVVVLAEHNRTRNNPYWNSEKKAKESNVPFINFYTHMPNERDFVISRIKRLMG